ncbi:MAG: Stp1/IreP family PP2C-type Ser/Thr phosphatase [candidate division Zixibacteria bacterium]|nr:Stp1/IreP family PP2C-type Ser/Thr phosphatase [candidate division Zixibacteria bacterium]
MSLKVRVIDKSDKGLVRTGNEDFVHIDAENHVYAVCDGMGGHQAGEVASMTASETIFALFNHYNREILDDPNLDVKHSLPPSGELLLKSIRMANRAIHRKAQEDSGRAGMGTTIVAVALEADVMSIAHVGDSRAYKLRGDMLEPLTRDHSWVAEMQAQQNLSKEEASSIVGKNVITRALGVRERVEVDYRMIKITSGDIFILCTDGLCGFADDEEIFAVASKSPNELERLANNLVQMANDRGGSDNVSVVVIQILEVRESPLPALDLFTLSAEEAQQLEAEDEWLKRIKDDSETQLASNANVDGHKRGGAMLMSIFALFAIVAILIIYFAQSH